MKKSSYLVAALLFACAAPTLTSCYVGSFSLTNKFWHFNTTMTSNKYVNAVVGFILSPFEALIGSFVDVLILNTMEFWSGSNPLAATQTVKAQDGQTYAIAPDAEGGYIVTCQETGRQMHYIFAQETRTWSADIDGVEVKLFSMIDEENLVAYVDGQEVEVSLTEQGIQDFQMSFDAATIALK